MRTKYDVIFENLQEKVTNGELTMEDAMKVNDLAYKKYGDVVIEEEAKDPEDLLDDLEDLVKDGKVTLTDDDIKVIKEMIKRADDCDKKISVPTVKMLNFVEDEISGKSKVLESLNDGITIFQQMQHDCKVLETRKEILGPDIIPKHIGFLRKIAISISGFFKRWSVKIISSIVLIVG